MWDRLLVDCNIATMDPAVDAPFGAIENGAVGIQDGRIVRVGRRTELAGYQARKVETLEGAWITPGLVDCHTHLVFAGNRAGEYRAAARRRELRGDRPRRRRHRRDGEGDARGVARRAGRERRGRGCRR